MMKRPVSSSSSSLRSHIPCSDPDAEEQTEDHNGKEYQRHGNLFETIQRWMARNEQRMMTGGKVLVLLVFLIPPFKVIATVPHQTPHQTPIIIPTTTAAEAAAAASSQVGSVSNANNAQQQQQQEKAMLRQASPPATTTAAAAVQQQSQNNQQEKKVVVAVFDADAIPPCPNTPWKDRENLQGNCLGELKTYKYTYNVATTIERCASTCCKRASCISWQFRGDVGCIQGKDVRLGLERDGPAGWCSDKPPQKWSGQYLTPRGLTEGLNPAKLRKDACSTKSWNPNEQIGQCFGLGDEKKHASGSAEECMEACCKEEKFICGAWQWNKVLGGCFYSEGMHGCQGEGDPVEFEPFVGRRKRLQSRQYTDHNEKPWHMTMSEEIGGR